jgi:hypothetical protein
LTVAKASQAIPISAGTLRRAIRDGELRSRRIDRRTVLDVSDIVGFAVRRYERELMNRLIRTATTPDG